MAVQLEWQTWGCTGNSANALQWLFAGQPQAANPVSLRLLTSLTDYLWYANCEIDAIDAVPSPSSPCLIPRLFTHKDPGYKATVYLAYDSHKWQYFIAH